MRRRTVCLLLGLVATMTLCHGSASSDDPPPRTERERDAERKRTIRSTARDLTIPPVGSWRRRLAAEKSPLKFLPKYFPDLFYDPFTKNRKEMVEALWRAARTGGDQAIAGPRGEGKTVIVECVTIYCVFVGEVRFPLLCAATGEFAGQMLTNIKTQLETNDLLYADYPEICHPIRALAGAPQRAGMQTVCGQRTMIKWSGPKLVLPTVPREAVQRDEQLRAGGAVFVAKGLDAAIRGVRHGKLRPDFVPIDDPETRESADSEKQTTQREKIIEQDLAGVGGPGKRLGRVMLTTVQNRKCLSYKYTDPKQKPSWHGKRYKLLEKKPDREDLWDEYVGLRHAGMQEGDEFARKAHRFYLKNRKTMDAGAVVTSPKRFVDEKLPDGSKQEVSALQACYNIIADRGQDHFDTEYQNDPPEDEGQIEGPDLTAWRVQSQLSGYPRGIIPPDCKCLTSGIDVGKYALHWVVDAWRADATGFRIDYGVQEVHGTTTKSDDKAIDQAVLRALYTWRDETLAEPYATADGTQMGVAMTLVDAHYRRDAVYHFVRQVGQKSFRAAMGMGQSGDGATKANFRMPAKKGSGKKLGHEWFESRQANGVRLIAMNSDFWKRWKEDRYLTPTDRPGTFLLYGDEPRPHLAMGKHIVAEREEEEFVRGRGLVRRWKAVSRNNHWKDADYMSAVAGNMRGIRLLGTEGARRGGRTRKRRVTYLDL